MYTAQHTIEKGFGVLVFYHFVSRLFKVNSIVTGLRLALIVVGSADADLPALVDSDGDLPLVDSLDFEEFYDDSASFLVLLFLVSLPWFVPAEGVFFSVHTQKETQLLGQRINGEKKFELSSVESLQELVELLE
ncbi:hypothetical protein Tco_0011850 [Tanacetum coccineum]